MHLRFPPLFLPLLLAAAPVATAHAGPSRAQARAGQARPVVVSGPRVVLADLSPTAPRELSELDVAPAPAPGKSVVLSRVAVQAALRRAGADPHLADGLPAYYRVERASIQLSKRELQARIQQAVAAKLPVGTFIESVVGLHPMDVPMGELDVQVDFGRLRRATVASVSVRVEGVTYGRMNVTLNIGGTPKTPRLRRDLPRGAVVTRGDVALESTPLDRLPPRVLTRPEQLVGRQLTQPQRAGRPVSRAATRTPPAIRRGATVDLVAARGGLRLSRRVIAQEPGHLGKTLRVRPVDGTGTIVARVVSSREVRIELGGTP